MIEYLPIETHGHTLHSDGTFTTQTLACAAIKEKLAGVIITDHNTLSAFDSLAVLEIPIIKGVEWTTYYGHLLAVGECQPINWWEMNQHNIDEYLRVIRRQNTAIGIAHPFNEGAPLCSGCRWEYSVKNWNNIDYIEVWSEPDPMLSFKNQRAYEWWQELLNSRHRLAATAGRDWHGEDKTDRYPAVTYLGIKDGLVTPNSVAEALRCGRSFVTLGPVIKLKIDSLPVDFGSIITRKATYFEITVGKGHRPDMWKERNFTVEHINIINNGKKTFTAKIKQGQTVGAGIELSSGWLIIELTGEFKGKKDKLIAFTSPIYIK